MRTAPYLPTLLVAATAAILAAACTRHPQLPETYHTQQRQPVIRPDYTDVTIPPNIAPLNFKVLEGSDECIALITLPDGTTQTYGQGKNICFPLKAWRRITATARGHAIKVEIYAKDQRGEWHRYAPFGISVAEDSIDPYCSYRLISPSYVAYEMLSITQRNLTNFDERDIYNNMIVNSEKTGQCINCHSYQAYGTSNMQFHMRQGYGGTMIIRDGQPYKVDLKTDSTISAGVYPAWHPTLPLIAYSTNSTGQSFHTKARDKIEVEDSRSDIILYDIERNEVSPIQMREDEFEVFPWWAPDGNSLYYCSAHFEFVDSIEREEQVISRYREIQYDIYRRPFDQQTYRFGPPELIYAASRHDASATVPRVSPDGRYLLFAQGHHGCFHVWHPDADLYLTDLQTRRTRRLENVNSDDAESYHVWSSNGRWILFVSRRDDGNYSRLYIAHFDAEGHAHKAFELPQEDPDFYDFFLRSYNVPEFMREPVTISPQTLVSAARQDARKATYVPVATGPK